MSIADSYILLILINGISAEKLGFLALHERLYNLRLSFIRLFLSDHHRRSLLHQTHNMTDWHLQGIPLIYLIFIMSLKLLCVIQNKMEKIIIIKNTPKTALRVRKTMNQEGNNTALTPNLQENNEKSLIDTIRKIVKEEFKEHETKISTMISNNLQNRNDCLHKMSKEMPELTKSLEFTQDQLTGEMNNIRENIKSLETSIKEIKDYLLDLNGVSSKLIELEDRPRWNNLRIHSIEETLNKTWEGSEIKIQELIKNKLKMNEQIKIDRCHRLLRKKNQNRHRTKKNQNQNRKIICCITKFKEKQK